MLLQTNSYLVPRDRLAAHDELMARFRRCFERLGVRAGQFEVYRQTSDDFAEDRSIPAVRCVQMMRFATTDEHEQVRNREFDDPEAQSLIIELSRLVDLPAQQRSGHFGGGFYSDRLDDAEPEAAAEALEEGNDDPEVGPDDETEDDVLDVGSPNPEEVR